MFINTRIKRNISFVLSIIGLTCIIARIVYVANNPDSGKAWFELCSIILLTYLCFDNFKIYSRSLKDEKTD